jgi:hypothetical protein
MDSLTKAYHEVSLQVAALPPTKSAPQFELTVDAMRHAQAMQRLIKEQPADMVEQLLEHYHKLREHVTGCTGLTADDDRF